MPTSTKPRRTYVSPLRKQLDAAIARQKQLETMLMHWYVPAKSIDGPCRSCGLPLLDSLHKDRSIDNAEL
jgi:hypothetical protein